MVWELFSGFCRLGKGSLFGFGSRDQVGCYRSLPDALGVAWDRRRLGKWTAAGRGASIDLGPLDLVFLETALVADLIMASISLQAFPLPTPFWALQYRKVSFLANGESLYPHL